MGRVLHRHKYSPLVVIFQIHVTDFFFCGVNSECKTPIPANTEAPSPLAISGEDMCPLIWQRAQFLDAFHIVEKCKNLAQLVRRIGRNTLRAVLSIEELQTFVSEVSDTHWLDCSL